jgi:hypothetical protein
MVIHQGHLFELLYKIVVDKNLLSMEEVIKRRFLFVKGYFASRNRLPFEIKHIE